MKLLNLLIRCAAFAAATPVHAVCSMWNVPENYLVGFGQCQTAPGVVMYGPYFGGIIIPEPPFEIRLGFDLPYRQRSDSPWAAGIAGASIYVEDFEDGQVNTPGLAMMLGVQGSGVSVDEDDGIFGNDDDLGNIYFTGFTLGGEVRATFSPDSEGHYPRYAGWVIDTLDEADARFEAYDPAGNLLARYVYVLPWGQFQFVGVYAPGGIGSIYSNGNERLYIDHVQYGYSIPEPAAPLLALAAGAAALTRRRQG